MMGVCSRTDHAKQSVRLRLFLLRLSSPISRVILVGLFSSRGKAFQADQLSLLLCPEWYGHEQSTRLVHNLDHITTLLIGRQVIPVRDNVHKGVRYSASDTLSSINIRKVQGFRIPDPLAFVIEEQIVAWHDNAKLRLKCPTANLH
jgi:hypothetical protein